VGPYLVIDYYLQKDSEDANVAGAVETSDSSLSSRSLVLGPRVTNYQERPWGFYELNAMLAYTVSGTEAGPSKVEADGFNFQLEANYGYRLESYLLVTGGASFSYLSISEVKMTDSAKRNFKGGGHVVSLNAKLLGLRYQF
jgi:hypothetical protein